MACKFGYIGIAIILIEKGADIQANMKLDKKTALHLAAENGFEEMVNFLLSKNLSMDALTKINWTPIYLAVGNSHLKVVQALLDNGANVNSFDPLNGLTLLHVACLNNDLNMLLLLLSRKASVDLREKSFGGTALYLCCENNFVHLASELLNFGAAIECLTFVCSSFICYFI